MQPRREEGKVGVAPLTFTPFSSPSPTFLGNLLVDVNFALARNHLLERAIQIPV